MPRLLFTADLHLTARPRDEYRWEVFPWLKRQAVAKEVDALFILGDLTEGKDHHSAELTNRLIMELRSLAEVAHLVLLKGNHDYVDPNCPFFRFVQCLENVLYVGEPQKVNLYGKWSGPFTLLALPHARKWRATAEEFDFGDFPLIVLHQTVKGVVVNGMEATEGVPPVIFERVKGHVIAGDIHVPQWVGPVVYCGAPHPVDFGDTYDPRVLYLDTEANKLTSIRHPTIRKQTLTVDSPKALEDHAVDEGDQVRVVLQLHRRDFPLWREYRGQVEAWLKERGAIVCGVELREVARQVSRTGANTPRGQNVRETLRLFCEAQKVDKELRGFGESCLA